MIIQGGSISAGSDVSFVVTGFTTPAVNTDASSAVIRTFAAPASASGATCRWVANTSTCANSDGSDAVGACAGTAEAACNQTKDTRVDGPTQMKTDTFRPAMQQQQVQITKHVVSQTVSLAGLTVAEFSAGGKARMSFLQAMASTLGVAATDIVIVDIQESTSGRRVLMRLILTHQHRSVRMAVSAVWLAGSLLS